MRYPKGGEPAVPAGYEPDYRPYQLYRFPQSKTVLVTYGRLFFEALQAAQRLEKAGIPVSVLKLTRIKPLEADCIRLMNGFDRIVFFEESSRAGGIGEYVGSLLEQIGYQGEFQLQAIQPFVGTCKVEPALHRFHLDADGMVQVVRREVSP